MEERDEKFLRAAMQLGMYYAYLAQALRRVINPEGPVALPDEVLGSELDRLRSGLISVLANHRAIREKVEQVDRKVGQIRLDAAREVTWGEAVKEAKRLLPEIETRAQTVSDLVALMRGL